MPTHTHTRNTYLPAPTYSCLCAYAYAYAYAHAHAHAHTAHHGLHRHQIYRHLGLALPTSYAFPNLTLRVLPKSLVP
ncbi:hypothetical protein K431DRAFT_284763 [Polychaeton citri CBS 116435]|uniref:Uncharacterized protein n=1 Tax=Polychaeton citri CBS 116435 TaxID=1314669 RepID=A0A9P4QAX0_9PEZI|nr:hypothetical protein K431DRAFT_284763 [Polychaeton citri CBS 116435]